MSTPLDVQIVKHNQKVVNKIFIIDRNDTIENIINKIYDVGNDQKSVYFGTKQNEFVQSKMREIDDLKMTFDQALQLDDFTKLLVVLYPEIIPISENDAFSVLMNASRKVSLPEKKDENSGKSDMFNAILDYLTDCKVGFFTNEDKESKNFMNVLVTALWLIDGQIAKIEHICGEAAIPVGLRFKSTFRRITHNDRVKKALPNLKQSDFVDVIFQLEKLCARKFIQTAMWTHVLSDITTLLNTFERYMKHLQNASDQRAKLQQTECESDINRKTFIIDAKPASDVLRTVYGPLNKYLAGIDYYTPVNMCFYAPFERRAKYHFTKGLKVDVPVKVYRTFNPSCVFIWKIPLKMEDRKEEQNDRTILNLEKNLAEIVMRDKAEMLDRRFGNNSKWNDRDITLAVNLMTGKCILLN